MKTTYREIKHRAKRSIKGHMGEAILVALILPIAFSMIGSFLNTIFSVIHWSVPAFTVTFINAISTYITIRMIIKIVRFKSDKIFTAFLGTKKGIINSMGFAVITLSFGLVYFLFFWKYFEILWDLLRIMQTQAFIENPNAIEAWANSITFPEPSFISIILSMIYTVFIIVISVRISFTTYIIADSDLTLLEAIKKSWKITRGNWWRIVIFPLSFIPWIFAIIFTLGLAVIYVGPYIAIAHGAFYDALLLEQGEVIDSINLETNVLEDSTDENALDEKKDTFDKHDPFENYYE